MLAPLPVELADDCIDLSFDIATYMSILFDVLDLYTYQRTLKVTSCLLKLRVISDIEFS
jgi:hypothetical protein